MMPGKLIKEMGGAMDSVSYSNLTKVVVTVQHNTEKTLNKNKIIESDLFWGWFIKNW